ncbi:unnamed protein product [Cyprideis torosa]|uniref:Uncharacterized protein n=1 Tax=Cyprideis torosa TaxID=163714 RepID=A0A7R8WCM0_9CRUS|nr:unnamed protein product [Cyprideis torosa]CAG0893625.1 unnamed protein product [Cyprideis torosa]
MVLELDKTVEAWSKFRVESGPPSAYYIPKFITESEESMLLEHVYNVPKPKWTVLGDRRLQNWGGIPNPKGMIAEELPKWLEKLCCQVTSPLLQGKSLNHVLINEYLPGQGILPHTDGPLYFPVITTLSLGSSAVLDFYEQFEGVRNKVGSMLLQPRSLVVFTEDLYTKYLHGIDGTKEQPLKDLETSWNFDKLQPEAFSRSTRISLTIRHVPKVSKLKLSTFFGRKR